MKSQHSRIYKDLLEALKNTRVAAGITQVEAAAKLKKHAPYISKIESGERRIDVIELYELCQIYNVSVTKILKKIGIS
jgi:transcriptional regulator with XRE-family HTH domain